MTRDSLPHSHSHGPSHSQRKLPIIPLLLAFAVGVLCSELLSWRGSGSGLGAGLGLGLGLGAGVGGGGGVGCRDHRLQVTAEPQQQQQQQQQQEQEQNKPLADGCHSVYLDLGTNIGIQIRKLYEPHLYPNALITPSFIKYFGDGDRHHVCSFGFEPNPRHTGYLQSQERVYRLLGYRTHVFTNMGVFDHDDVAQFVSDNAPNENEWAGKVVAKTHISVQDQEQAGTQQDRNSLLVPNKLNHNKADSKKTYDVKLINFGVWFKNNIASRFIPQNSTLGPPRVVIKLDIEGPDWLVIAQLLDMGLWCCCVDFLYEEHFSPVQLAFLYQMPAMVPGCRANASYVDDETYFRDRFPFPPAPDSAAAAAWLDRFPLPQP